MNPFRFIIDALTGRKVKGLTLPDPQTPNVPGAYPDGIYGEVQPPLPASFEKDPEETGFAFEIRQPEFHAFTLRGNARDRRRIRRLNARRRLSWDVKLSLNSRYGRFNHDPA